MFLIFLSVHRAPPLVKVLGGPPGQCPREAPCQGLGAPQVKVQGGSPSQDPGQGPGQGPGAPLVKVQKCREPGQYTSCGHAGGLSCFEDTDEEMKRICFMTTLDASHQQ